jgi:thioredoxin reductase (NADPH)
LIRRIEERANIELLTNMEVISLAGNDHLETVEWRNYEMGETQKRSIRALSSMIGCMEFASNSKVSGSGSYGFSLNLN